MKTGPEIKAMFWTVMVGKQGGGWGRRAEEKQNMAAGEEQVTKLSSSPSPTPTPT